MQFATFALLIPCFLVLFYFRQKAGKELIEEYFIDSQTLFRLLLPAFLTVIPTYLYFIHINHQQMPDFLYAFATADAGFSLQMLTVPLIHFNFTHLIINLLMLAFVLPYAVARFSVLQIYLSIFLVSVASALPMYYFSAWAYPYFSGASAGIIALYSLIGTCLLTIPNQQRRWLGCLLLAAGAVQCIGGMILNAKSADIAHWFGLIVGVVVGLVLAWRNNKQLFQRQMV